MNNDNGNKFQWSKFSPNRSEQYVIRTDNEDEFDTLVNKYKNMLPQEHAFPDDEGPIATSVSHTQKVENDWCSIHKIQMRKWTKNGQSWYSHKFENGWCNGKPEEKA